MAREPKFYRKFDYNKGLLPNPYLAELETGVKEIEGAIPKSGYTIGWPGWGILYHVILASLEPGKKATILETGTNQACSTIVLAQALLDSDSHGVVHTIEIDQKNYDISATNLNKAGVDHVVKQHLGDSKIKLKEILPDIGNLSVVFLDGSHLHDDVCTEFELIYDYLGDNSPVLLDNTYQIAEGTEDPRVHGGLKTIMGKYGGQLINLPFVSWFTPGLAIWQKRPFEWCDPLSGVSKAPISIER